MSATFPIAFAKKTAVKPEVKPAEVLTERRARISGAGQPPYIAFTLDVQRIQNALRSAERGDTYLLATICRDMVASYGHLDSEWTKRKCVITGNPETLIPHDPDNKDDVIACEVIKDMIDNCRNWRQGLVHLLDATLYPVAAAEKIFEPVDVGEQNNFRHPLRYILKEIAPIDHTLECFKIPYLPSFYNTQNPASQYNPDDWESWLRFYKTSENGAVLYNTQEVYAPNPDEHIVHRGNMLSPTIPPNFMGHMRKLLFPWLLATQDRDWWALAIQKFGSPITVLKVNTQQADSVLYAQQALALCQQLGGLVIDTKAEAMFAQTNSTDLSNVHMIFQKWLDSHVSRIVVGQSLSSMPEKTGMGSGVAQQSEEIREDIRQSDTINLSDTLRRQLFAQFLKVNGYKGRPPQITWGGMRPGEAAIYAKTLSTMATGGYIVDDGEGGMETVNRNMGIKFKHDPQAMTATAGRENNWQEKTNPKPVKY